MSTPRDSKFRLPSRPEVMEVTPEMAGDWLDHRNTPLRNRNLSQATAAGYGATMKAGEWKLTAQGLSFDTDGWVLDGQHRLQAVRIANTAVKFWVFPDEPRDTFAFYDVGKRRQAAQLLHVPNRFVVASTVRYTAVADNLYPPRAVGTAVATLTNKQTLDLVRLGGSPLEEAARIAVGLTKRSGLPASPHAAVLYQALQTEHKDRVEEWVEALSYGNIANRNDPRLRLRNAYLSPAHQRSVYTRTATLPYALTVKAWNGYVLDQEREILGFRSNEDVPKVIGYTPRNPTPPTR